MVGEFERGHFTRTTDTMFDLAIPAGWRRRTSGGAIRRALLLAPVRPVPGEASPDLQQAEGRARLLPDASRVYVTPSNPHAFPWIRI